MYAYAWETRWCVCLQPVGGAAAAAAALGTDYGIWIRGGPGWRRKIADDEILGRARREKAPNESENERLHGGHCDVRGRMRRPRENDEGCWEDERQKATNALSSPRKCRFFPFRRTLFERDERDAPSRGIRDIGGKNWHTVICINELPLCVK